MSRVVSPAKSASVAMPAHAWCITRSDLPPACEYDDLITCGINAILSGSSCAAAEPRMIAASNGRRGPIAAAAQVARTTQAIADSAQ